MLTYKDNWVSVPTNSVVTIHKQTVLLHPILDEFYGEGLNHDRSSCYAVSKGLVSTAPGTTVAPQAVDAETSCPSSTAPGTDAEPRTITSHGLDSTGLSHLNLGSQNGVAVSH